MGYVTVEVKGIDVELDVKDVLSKIRTSVLEREVLTRFDSDLVREEDVCDDIKEEDEDEEDIHGCSLEYVRDLSGDSLRRFLCDLAYLGYHSSKVEIMNVINERF